MRLLKNTMRPAMRPGGCALRSSSDATGTTSASMPSAGVATLPPSAATTSACGQGATISARASPRIHRCTVTGSVRTLAKPSTCSFCTAHATARASPGEPARRGPTSVVSDRTSS